MTARDSRGGGHGLTAEEAVVFAMVMMSASDADMSLEELETVRDVLADTPALENFDQRDLPRVAGRCAMIITGREGRGEALRMVRAATPEDFRSVAYEAAMRVAAADGVVKPAERALLEALREALDLGEAEADALRAKNGFATAS